MNIIKKASVAANEQDAQEIDLLHSIKGYETCQDIQTIKEELARLKIEMDKYNKLAMTTAYNSDSTKYYQKSHDLGIRYWAIRWVMDWEKEIPQ